MGRHSLKPKRLRLGAVTKALNSFAHYQEQGRFAAWLWSIARYTLRDWQRRQRTEIAMDVVAPMLADPAPAPDERAVEAEQARTLHELLDTLPPDQRQALILRFFDGLSNNEVAAVLGRSIGSVKMLVHRAVGQLRRQYHQAQQAKVALTLLFAPHHYALQPIACQTTTRRA